MICTYMYIINQYNIDFNKHFLSQLLDRSSKLAGLLSNISKYKNWSLSKLSRRYIEHMRHGQTPRATVEEEKYLVTVPTTIEGVWDARY